MDEFLKPYQVLSEYVALLPSLNGTEDSVFSLPSAISVNLRTDFDGFSDCELSENAHASK